MSENKERFASIVQETITRKGIDTVMKWLESKDFYIAPASTRFHSAFDGGLLAHSLNVYDCLLSIDQSFNLELKPESMAITALFHDLCKVDVYKKEKRNRKNAAGQWESYDTYAFDEAVPLGHGEKSVILLQGLGLQLSRDEMYAIRWHMGGFDATAKSDGRSLTTAFEKSKLAVALHMADLAATYFKEEA